MLLKLFESAPRWGMLTCVVFVAPTRPRSAPGGRGGRGGRGARAGAAPGRAARAARGTTRARPPWRRPSTHTTRADIMIWRQSEYWTHTHTHTHTQGDIWRVMNTSSKMSNFVTPGTLTAFKNISIPFLYN